MTISYKIYIYELFLLELARKLSVKKASFFRDMKSFVYFGLLYVVGVLSTIL